MIRRILFCIVLIKCLSFAQNARLVGSGERGYIAVPMVGKGTWEDPKRPAFLREAGVPFSFQASDDGTMALVEISPRNVLEMRRLEEEIEKEPRAKLFRPGKDKLADAVAELRKWKKDFDPTTFQKAGGAPSDLPSPAPQTGK